MTEAWFLASRIAIQLVHDNRVLESPAIVCKDCGAFLTILADMDTISSLYTLAVEHTCHLSTDVDVSPVVELPPPPA